MGEWGGQADPFERVDCGLPRSSTLACRRPQWVCNHRVGDKHGTSLPSGGNNLRPARQSRDGWVLRAGMIEDRDRRRATSGGDRASGEKDRAEDCARTVQSRKAVRHRAQRHRVHAPHRRQRRINPAQARAEESYPTGIHALADVLRGFKNGDAPMILGVPSMYLTAARQLAGR